MLPSVPGSLIRLCLLMGTISLLSGPVAASLATKPRVCAGALGDSASACHRRLVYRARRSATSPIIRRMTPHAMRIGVPNSLIGKDPDYIDLDVSGTGFRHGAVVRWDDKPLPTHFIGPTRLRARVPYNYLFVNTMRIVKPKTPGGSGPRGMGSDGATGTAWVRVHDVSGRTSNRIAFTVSYVVVGG